ELLNNGGPQPFNVHGAPGSKMNEAFQLLGWAGLVHTPSCGFTWQAHHFAAARGAFIRHGKWDFFPCAPLWQGTDNLRNYISSFLDDHIVAYADIPLGHNVRV